MVTYFKRGDLALSNDDRVELRNIIRQFVQRIDMKPKRNGRDYVGTISVTLHDDRTLRFVIFAKHRNTMKRNAKGHPLKTLGTKHPQYEIGLGDPVWAAIPSADGTIHRVAEGRGKRHIDVDTPGLALRSTAAYGRPVS